MRKFQRNVDNATSNLNIALFLTFILKLFLKLKNILGYNSMFYNFYVMYKDIIFTVEK